MAVLTPQELTAFRKTFLPPGYVTPQLFAGGAKQQSGSPAARYQHPLNQTGFNAVHLIEKEYTDQIGNWKTALGDVVMCLSAAITRKTAVLRAAEAERQADAAFHAMIISLLAVGPMSFLGAYVEHAVVPNIVKLIRVNDPLIMGLNTGSPFIVKSTKVVSVQRFSALQADAFGGIAKDVGSQLVPLTFPKPESVNVQLDSPAGVEQLRNNFLKFVEASASVVVAQFTNVQTWMNVSNEFGEAWEIVGGPDPRASIRRHLDGLRKEWAKNWKFFGTKPVPISTSVLTDTIERALWAGHLARTFSDPKYVREPDAMTMTEGFAEAVGGKVLENAVVTRLKYLNIVTAETEVGLIGQMGRLGAGAPLPTLRIDGEVDRLSEVLRLKTWAQVYLDKLDGEAQQRFFPPARTRPIEPIHYH